MKYDKNLFFDNQLHNKATSWRLVAQDMSESGTVKDGPYNLENPVLRGIITDTEFGVSGSHDFGESELLAGAKSLVGKALGLANNISEGLSLGKAFERDVTKSLGIDSVAQSGIDMISNGTLKDIAQKVYDNAGSKFTTALDYVKVFKGTGLEIEFPPLDTRIYHKSLDGKTVPEVLKSLLKRFVGELIQSSVDGIDNILGIQAPPNGYTPSFKVIGGKQDTIKGSFGLIYGPYTIENLLVTQFQYRLSTFVIREPQGGGDEFKMKDINPVENMPLYLDVRIGVQPCTYISRQTLMEIMNLNKS